MPDTSGRVQSGRCVGCRHRKFTVEVWPKGADGNEAERMDADVVDVVPIDDVTHLVVVLDD